MHRFAHAAGQVAYTDRGSGPAIVMLHAGGSSSVQWDAVAQRLEPDFRLVLPDLWDFGQTGPWPGAAPLSHDDQAALVGAVARAASLTRFHLVGHSYGGATAVRLILGDAGFAGSLILIEPMLAPLLAAAGDAAAFGDYTAIADRFIDAAAAGEFERAWSDFVDYRNGAGAWARLSEGRKARFVAGTDSAIGAFRANLSNPTSLSDVRSIRVPTTIVCGGNTTTPDRRVTEILHEAIGHSRLEVLAGAEHMSPLTHPDDVAAVIRRHCETHAIETR